MARNNRGGRNGNNNNPSGRNQYSSGVMDMARERPIAAAAAAAAAVGAGVFLWSRRNEISDQIGQLSDQFSEWTQSMGSSGAAGSDEFDDTAGLTTSGSAMDSATGKRGRSSSTGRRGMSETGGGNASLGAQSGGGGMSSSASGRGRARQSTPV